MAIYKHKPIRQTNRNYTTGGDTFVPAETHVLLLADRSDDHVSLVQQEGTQLVFQVPTSLLKDPK